MRACCAPRGEGREGGVGFLLSPDARFNGSLASGHQGVSLARGHEGIKLQTFVISSFCVIVCVYDRPPKNNVCMPAVCIIGHKKTISILLTLGVSMLVRVHVCVYMRVYVV